MKKKIGIFFLIVLIIIIISLVLVYIYIKNQLTIRAVIVEYNENWIFVMNVKNKEPLYIHLPKDTNLKFEKGQEVIVFCIYGGASFGTYPKTITSESIKEIKIIKKDSNIQIPESILRLRRPLIQK